MAQAGGDRTRWPGHLRWALFLALVFVWLQRVVDPSRCYHAADLTGLPAFSPDVMFRRAHLTTIGGPLGYVAAWICQLLVWRAVGAAVLTALVGAVGPALDWAVGGLAGRRLAGWRYAPAFLLVLLDGHYLCPIGWQLGWVLALAAAGALLRARQLPLVSLLAAEALLYYLLGGPWLVAAPLLALGAARQTRWWAVALVLWPLLLPALSTWLGFDRPLAEAYTALWGVLAPIDRYGLAYAGLIGMVAFSLLLGGLAVRAAASDAAPRAPRPALVWAAWAAGLALLLVGAHDRLVGARLELAADAARGQWTALLAAADRFRPDDLTQFEGYDIILALVHTGAVGERLFHYTLPPGSLLREDPRLGDAEAQLELRTRHGLAIRNLELELGFVNESEHALHETIETQGPYAALLAAMGRVQVLLGRPRAAAVYFRLAAAQPGDPQHVRPLLRAIAGDPTLAGDPLTAELAAHRLQADLYRPPTATARLEAVVAEHPDHHLAWQYLLLRYLLANQIDQLVAELPNLPRHGGEPLPRHCQEAVVCWEFVSGRRAELGPWEISPETRTRFQDFIAALGCGAETAARILRAPGQPPLFAFRAFKGPWNETYYYYRLFGVSGALP